MKKAQRKSVEPRCKSALLNQFKRSKTALALVSLCMSLPASQVFAQELSIPCDEVEEKALASANDNEVTRITAYQPAKPIDRLNPRYPTVEARLGREGWVKLSYVVDEEGKVKDPVVDDFYGSRAFKQSALRAVEKWTFDPAMKDGEPTQQCHQSVQIDFIMGHQTGASRKFVKAYKNADALFKAGDIDAADKALSELKNWDTLNRYENTWLLNLDSQIASEQGDLEREAQSLERMLASNGSMHEDSMVFDEKFVAYNLQRKIILDSQRGLYADALASFDTLKEVDEEGTRVAAITPLIEKVEAAIESAENLQIPITIGEDGNLLYTLVRNQFAFNGIQGELQTVEVRCETHREKFTVAEDHVWKIPESWGQCRVLVEGESATTFNLIEVAQG